ncbi:MAG: hypothetical protein ABIH66_00170 [bacterium]
MKSLGLVLLKFFPFISIFVMIAVCIVGVKVRAPEQMVLLRSCIPIGLWALYGTAKQLKSDWRRARGG